MSLEAYKDGLLYNENSYYAKDWPPVFVQLKVQVTKNLRDRNYETLFDKTVNFCKLHTAMAGNFIVKAVLENYEKALNVKIQCPMKKV
jgi:hypothetical protein